MRPLWIFGLGLVLTGCLDKFPEAPDFDGDGFTVAEGDCDDEDDTRNPDTVWYADADSDGFGAAEATLAQCEAPDGYVAVTGDCDDASASVHEGAEEVCDGADQDCDGVEDDGTPGYTFYADGDQDTFGDLATAVTACDVPTGYVTDSTDCDDLDDAVFPGATELCNGYDDDCDDQIDSDATDLVTWYQDGDNDGWGTSASIEACDQPSGYASASGDCDDTDDAYRPDAPETDCADPNDYNCDGSSGYADKDSDGFAACEECDDDDAAVNPDAAEACNGYDDDCDASVDEGAAVGSPSWYFDGDRDGYGDDTTATVQCDAPSSYHVTVGGDCDDSDKDYHPAAVETDCSDPNDYDCDGVTIWSDDDSDGWAECLECDDENAGANPDATEMCDGFDNDCDGNTDEATAADAPTWYHDADGDGWGVATTTRVQCSAPSGYVSVSGDCDDTDTAFHPTAPETDCADPSDYNCDGTVGYADTDGDGFAACEECDDTNGAISPDALEECDSVDNDCDGTVDEDDAIDAPTWYVDGDIDGYGATSATKVQCAKPTGYVASSTDCDDASDSINPGASEVCDVSNTDEDCDGKADDTDTGGAVGKITTYADADSDGYGSSADAGTGYCELPSGRVTNKLDCNDGSATINPSVPEKCDAANTDEDCDGKADDADTSPTGRTSWYTDGDGDRFGAGAGTLACDSPSGRVGDNTDCDDADEFAYPDAPETCDTIDNDCDSSVDEHTWALQFDGVDDLVQLPSIPSSTAFTIEAWVLGAPTSATNEALFGTACGELYWSTSGFGVVRYDACTGTGATHENTAVAYTSWPTDWWHLALVSSSSTSASVYVNGTSVGTVSLTASTRTYTHAGGIGGVYSALEVLRADATVGSFRVSDTARYSAAFTPDEDLAADADTVLRYALDEGSGTTVEDSSAAYDGTVFGGATWVNDGPECP
jgi:hypothetical protein